jgi:hypothetical protein
MYWFFVISIQGVYMRDFNRNEFMARYSDFNARLVNSIYESAEKNGLLPLLMDMSYAELREVKYCGTHSNSAIQQALDTTLREFGKKEGASGSLEAWALAHLEMRIYAEQHGVAEFLRVDDAFTSAERAKRAARKANQAGPCVIQ